MLKSSTQLQNTLFYLVERTRMTVKCTKIKTEPAKHAKLLSFIVKYANLWCSCCRGCHGYLSSLLSMMKHREMSKWLKYICMYMLWFTFTHGLTFFELVSVLFAIVPDYGNEYITKENKNRTSFQNFAPKLNWNHNIIIQVLSWNAKLEKLLRELSSFTYTYFFSW